jgi:hypothetical protein
MPTTSQVLYTREDDGLSPSNPWAGYHIILNPDFRKEVCVCVWRGA